jgi:hypothetical protein
MHITRNSLETARGPSDWFTGDVYIDTVAAPSDGTRVSASSVHFTPGARTAWHTHPNGQRSGSPKASASASVAAGRSKSSAPVTVSSSNRVRSEQATKKPNLQGV